MNHRIVMFLPIVLWVVVLTTSLMWNIRTTAKNIEGTVISIGRSFFNEIETTRLWNALHGGVYVPITETTQPNQYLETPNRDVTTTEGLRLTTINPAFMTRQISEIANVESNIHYHITSLKPIRPANQADEWENEALKGFETGNVESFRFVQDAMVYRYMAPLLVKDACLTCHAKQGYKYGDVMGGISVTIPAKEFVDTVRASKDILICIHVIALVIGIIVFILFKKSRNKQMELIEQKNLALDQNKTAVESVNTRLMQEIDTRKKATEELSIEKIFSETLINSLPGIFYLLSEDGRQIRRNKNHETITGYSDEEFKRLHILEMFPEKDRKHIEKAITQVLSNEEASVEANLLTKNGAKISYFFTTRRMTINNELYIIGTGSDISEQKKIEVELRRNMTELEELSKMTFGREQMMISLKEEINQLMVKLGEKEKYEIVKR